MHVVKVADAKLIFSLQNRLFCGQTRGSVPAPAARPEILRPVAGRVKGVLNVNVLKVYLDHTSSLNVSLILLAFLFLFPPSLFLCLFSWVLSLTESITQSELA